MEAGPLLQFSRFYWEFREREPLPLLLQMQLTLVGDSSDLRCFGSITEQANR